MLRSRAEAAFAIAAEMDRNELLLQEKQAMRLLSDVDGESLQSKNPEESV